MRIESRFRLVHAFRARASSALLAALILIGGSSRAWAAPRRPVILIPGLPGSVLERQDTHNQVWGNYFRLSFASPHRGLVDPTHDGLELPTASTNLREHLDSLVPTGLLETTAVRTSPEARTGTGGPGRPPSAGRPARPARLAARRSRRS